MKFYIHTFGCQMNENDSQLISGLLISAGFERTNDLSQADIIIVNTCCIRESAENRALGYIGSLKKLKEDRPELIICVTGCMAQKEGTAQKFKTSYRHVGILTGTFAASRIPRYIAEYAATGSQIIDVEERYDGEELLRNRETALTTGKSSWRARVNINFGCNNFCSYCIVPYVRGRERSRTPIDIIQEVQALAAGGVREIELLGQNVNSYGREFVCAQVDFAGLLQALDRVEGIERIRYMTSHPRDLDRRMVETIAGSRHVCHHFHLPVQSGCDRILDLMNRGYTTSQYEEKLSMIRQLCPDAVITTDLIVGFPGETEEDFNKTIDFISNCHFDTAYTFLYSRRSGTPAAKMQGQVDEQIKKDRLARLASVQDPISLEINRQMLYNEYEIMVEGPSKNDPETMSGRTDGNKIVIFPKTENVKSGSLHMVRITEARTWNLMGELR